jgi:uncharacterized protein
MATDKYETEVLKWRKERADRLAHNEKSWLALAGLFWLKEGDNSFGSDPKSSIVLPVPAPAKAGVFKFSDEQVTVKTERSVKITCNDGPLPARALRDDQQAEPDFLILGRLILVVIKRGTSTLIRVWDKESPLRKAFSGLNWYPYKPEYRIDARYEGYSPFRMVRQKDIIGEISDTKMIGTITFEWEGKEYRLDAEDAGDGLFIAIHDRTSSHTTYAGGRYLLTDKPKDGKVVLDFNKAYNMPCAYTVYATCGLPIPENRLPIAIEAGEQKYQEGH